MIRQDEIALVIDSQRETFLKQDSGFTRDALTFIPVSESFATIITGIRRCGKSTLLLQLLRRDYQDAVYLNFDDIRLSSFETGDFTRLHREIEKREIKVLFFDEIQKSVYAVLSPRKRLCTQDHAQSVISSFRKTE